MFATAPFALMYLLDLQPLLDPLDPRLRRTDRPLLYTVHKTEHIVLVSAILRYDEPLRPIGPRLLHGRRRSTPMSPSIQRTRVLSRFHNTEPCDPWFDPARIATSAHDAYLFALR